MAFVKKYIYEHLCDHIIREARNRGLKKDDKLPPLQEMAKAYNVSETPLRRALAELAENEIIRSRRGSGYYLMVDPEGLVPASTDAPNDASSEQDSDHEEPSIDLESFSPFQVATQRLELKLQLIDGLPCHQKVWNQLITAFNQTNTYIRIAAKFSNQSSILRDSLINDPQNAPDIIQVNQRDMFTIAERRAGAPLDANDHDFGILTDEVLYNAAVSGQLHGLPVVGTSTALLINTKLLKQLGLKAPGSSLDFDGFIAFQKSIISRLRKKQITDQVFALASNQSSFYYFCANSLDFFDSKTRAFNWSSPAFVEMLATLQEIGSKNSGIPTDQRFKEEGGLNNLFLSDRLVTMIIPEVFIDLFPNPLPKSTIIRALPVNSDGANITVANYCVANPESAMRSLAADFLNFCYSRTGLEIIQQSGLFPVAHAENNRRLTLNSVLNAPSADYVVRNPLLLSRFGVRNYEFIAECFSPVTDMVRDNVITPDAAIELLNDRY